MDSMMRTVLVALDGSSLAERALAYAVAIARASRARVVLVRVAPPRPVLWGDPVERRVRDLADAQAYLEGVVDRLRKREVLAEPALSFGEPAGVILDEIAIADADLVVIASHGRRGAGRWLYGSVADEVVRQTPACPVLLVTSACDHPWLDDHIDRIVVALDGSTFAEEVLAPVSQLAHIFSAELVLLRVLEPAHPGRGDFVSEAEIAAAREYLAQTVERLHPAERVLVQVRIGAVAPLIARVAREESADLIALATHGRTGLARLTLGSVATATLQRAGVPVLLVRPSGLLSATPPGVEAGDRVGPRTAKSGVGTSPGGNRA
jgi:nucleotide-binding universal stress UspA family protein